MIYIEKLLTKYWQTEKSLIDFVKFSCFTYKETNKALLRFIVIDMPKNELRQKGNQVQAKR